MASGFHAEWLKTIGLRNADSNPKQSDGCPISHALLGSLRTSLI